ncbi:MAG: triose-phosphate isomerase [Bacteroidia bacterium]
MSRKKIVAGNWKMNKTFAEAVALASEIVSSCKKDDAVTKIIFPPFPFLSSISGIVMDRSDFFSGAQNCHTHDSGAYTGEVSALALRSCQAKYVLVGHSERRQYFNEGSELLKAKIDACFRNELIPVYCVGEILSERKEDRHFDVVALQLSEVIAHLTQEQLSRLIIAYEPVWAIGTGETASPAQAQEMHAFIRKVISKLFNPATAAEVPLLYGGSCNPGNAKELFSCPDVDGGLIGGASLKAADFTAIINSF